MTAVSVNFLPVTLGGTTMEIVVLAALHFVFINRIRLAQNAARAQRALDLERFQTLASASRDAGGRARDSLHSSVSHCPVRQSAMTRSNALVATIQLARRKAVSPIARVRRALPRPPSRRAFLSQQRRNLRETCGV